MGNIYLYINDEEVRIVSSDIIPPGYAAKKITYTDDLKLDKEKYDGKIVVNFYDDTTKSTDIVNAVIPINASVK